MRAFTSCFTFSPIRPKKQNPEGEQTRASDTLAIFSQISRVWDSVSGSDFSLHAQDRMRVNPSSDRGKSGEGRGSFGVWRSHSQIKHNCLKRNDPEVNATGVASLDGWREGFKAPATANFDSGLPTKAFDQSYSTLTPPSCSPRGFTDPIRLQ